MFPLFNNTWASPAPHDIRSNMSKTHHTFWTKNSQVVLSNSTPHKLVVCMFAYSQLYKNKVRAFCTPGTRQADDPAPQEIRSKLSKTHHVSNKKTRESNLMPPSKLKVFLFFFILFCQMNIFVEEGASCWAYVTCWQRVTDRKCGDSRCFKEHDKHMRHQ